MAKKRLNLREFQQNLSDRMQAKTLDSTQHSKLGVLIGEQHYLLEMSDIGEVLSLPPLTPVPLSKPWYRGVANVRGNLYGVVDMAAYQHNGVANGAASNRLLLVADRYAFNAALLVDRVIGLRDASAWHMDGEDALLDEQGERWRTLDVLGLLNQPEFLQISL